MTTERFVKWIEMNLPGIKRCVVQHVQRFGHLPWVVLMMQNRDEIVSMDLAIFREAPPTLFQSEMTRGLVQQHESGAYLDEGGTQVDVPILAIASTHNFRTSLQTALRRRDLGLEGISTTTPPQDGQASPRQPQAASRSAPGGSRSAL